MKEPPLRMCAACRHMKPKSELLRVCKTSQDAPVFDITGKEQGRGAYVCRLPACITKAKKARAFERALSSPVSATLYDLLMEEVTHAQH